MSATDTKTATTIKGNYNVWKLNGSTRTYADVHLPYRDAIEYVIPVRYNAISGKGEQRELFASHARKLRQEMLDGNYTPAQLSANLRKNHRDANLKLTEEGRTFSLTISSDDPLAQTDGGHRYGALNLIARDLRDKLSKSAKDSERAKLQAQLDEVMNLEVGIRVYFDGDAQRDFIRLQSGRPVDAAHMLSLRIQKNVMGDPSFKLAFSVAKLLAKSDASPFHQLLRFDSKQQAKDTMLKQLPISTVMGKSSSDLGTSLVGLARVGSKKDASFLAHCVCSVYKVLATKAEKVFEQGKVLTPIRNGGTKGSATMLIGLGICLAHRLIVLNRELPTQEDVDRVATVAEECLNREVGGNFSGPVKRGLMGAFARDFFADLDVDKHDGIPTALLKATSASTFDAESLPKEPKGKPGRKKAVVAVASTSPDVDSPIPEMAPADFSAFDDEVTDESMNDMVNEGAPVYEKEEVTSSAPWNGSDIQG